MLRTIGREVTRLGTGLIGAVLFAAALAALGAAAFTDAFTDRVWSILSLDFGMSTISGGDGFAAIAVPLTESAALLAPGFTLALVIGVPIGVLLADRNAQPFVRPFTQLGLAVPVFIVALVFALVASFVAPGIEPGRGAALRDAFASNDAAAIVAALAALAPLILPIALAGAGAVASAVCTAMEEALGENYRQSLSELGLSPGEILRTYVARRALALSLLSVGDVLLATIGAMAIVERLFNWPGAGAQFIRAAALHDWAIVAALVFVIAVGRIAIDFAGAIVSAVLTGAER